jgi:glycosyltransferase involved in cell wall biosynthesis
MLLSVIIPTLNEADTIGETIKQLLNEGDKLQEIIVADNGSSDNTSEIAEKYPAKVKVLHLPEFKGKKYLALNYAASRARADILLFLDADTILPQGFPEMISEAFSDPRIGGGAFEFNLNHRGLTFRLITWLNRIRYRFRQRYYSDQGVFVKKTVFTTLG